MGLLGLLPREVLHTHPTPAELGAPAAAPPVARGCLGCSTVSPNGTFTCTPSFGLKGQGPWRVPRRLRHEVMQQRTGHRSIPVAFCPALDAHQWEQNWFMEMPSPAHRAQSRCWAQGVQGGTVPLDILLSCSPQLRAGTPHPWLPHPSSSGRCPAWHLLDSMSQRPDLWAWCLEVPGGTAMWPAVTGLAPGAVGMLSPARSL